MRDYPINVRENRRGKSRWATAKCWTSLYKKKHNKTQTTAYKDEPEMRKSQRISQHGTRS